MKNANYDSSGRYSVANRMLRMCLGNLLCGSVGSVELGLKTTHECKDQFKKMTSNVFKNIPMVGRR